MRYAELAELSERLSQTSKRLELRKMLAETLKTVPPAEMPPLLFLLQGQLLPEYEGLELGVADSLARRALAAAAGLDEAKVQVEARESGDLGTTAEKLLAHRPKPLDEPRPLGLLETYEAFVALARASGAGSQEEKIRRLTDLLGRASPLEAKHLLRFALGKLRLGVKEMTLLDALAEAFGGEETKAARQRIEAAFNVSSDLGTLGRRLAEKGLEAVDSIHAEPGKPIRMMLAEREASLKDVLERMTEGVAFEYKYDGLRIQAHIPERGPVRLFSRRLEAITDQFPDVTAALPSALRERGTILEGECVPVDPVTGELRPFQEISRRRGRKYDLEKYADEVPVRLLAFDLLMAGGTSTMELPYPERRRRLEEVVKVTEGVGLATREVIGDLPHAEKFFQASLEDGCEGIMAKSLSAESSYRAGARGFWWIKYKREYTHELADTVDTVIVGAYWGRGKRAGRYGAFLAAVYDPDTGTFPTLCKVGTGFDDETLTMLTESLKRDTTEGRPRDVRSELTPDVWLKPDRVLELRGAELTLSPTHHAGRERIRSGFGLALRFPRFTGRYREDKGPTEATTVAELLRLYQTQVRHAEAETPAEGSGPSA